MKILYVFTLIALVLNSIFTDLPLIQQKTVTRSLMFIFAPILFMLTIIKQNFKLNLDNISRFFLIYLYFSFVASLFMLVVFFLIEGDFYVYGKNLFLKLFEAFFTLSLLNFFVYYLFYTSVRNLEQKYMKIILNITFIMLIIAGVVEHLNPEIIDIFHTFPKPYERLRLFSYEPAFAIIIFSTVSFLVFFLAKSKIYKTFSFIVYIIGCIFIASKGIFISMIIASAIVILSKFFKTKSIMSIKVLTSILINSVLFLVISALFLKYIMSHLVTDILYFTSFITRFSNLLASVYVLIFFPLGLGYGTYLYFYPDLLIRSAALISDFAKMEFNLSEILYTIETGYGIGAKSTLATAVILTGWQGLIFYLFLLQRTLNNVEKLSNIPSYEKDILKFFTLTLFIQLLLGTELLFIYIVFLYIAIFEVAARGYAK